MGIRVGILGVVVMCLVACGGGTKESATVNDVTTKSFTLSLDVQRAGVSVRDVKEGDAIEAIAKVVQTTTVSREGRTLSSTTSAPSVPVEVTFSGRESVTLSPASGKVLTDASGVAKITGRVNAIPGAFVLVGVAATDGAPSASYPMQTTGVISQSLDIDLQRNGATTSTLTGGLVYDVTVKLTETFTKSKSAQAVSKAIGAKTINLSTDGGLIEPANGVVITDENGLAKARFKPNRLAGQYRIVAELDADTSVTENQVYAVVVDRITLGSGSPFAPTIVAVDPPVIAAGGSALLTVQIRNSAGALVDAPTSVKFSSGCATAGNATITSPVLSVAGVATANYRAGRGCQGTDQILAEATVEGLVFETQATGTVVIQPAIGERIEFIEAIPTALVLQGRASATNGLSEVSNVKFVVTNSQGVPSAGVPVQFSLNGVGNSTLSATSAVTTSDGIVNVQLRAGLIAAPIRILATLQNGARTLSDVITVSTGSPERRGLSLSASSFTPEAFNYDGEVVKINMRAVDRFGNPLPDRTRFAFSTEGGSIQPSCALVGGVCTVDWVSQAPRPINGRSSILVTSLGDESFTDGNGNGVYDSGEIFEDLAEAYRDDNENGSYDQGEFFVDSDNNGRYSLGNGRYDGLLCGPGTVCGPTGSVVVSAATVIVMTTSQQRITVGPSGQTIDETRAAQFEARIEDLNGNLPPAGTKVKVESSVGKLSGETEITIGTSTSPGPFVMRFSLAGEGVTGVGQVTVKATTPKAVASSGSASVVSASVCDAPVAPLPPNCQGGSTVGTLVATPTRVLVTAGQINVSTPVSIVARDSTAVARPFQGVVVNGVCALGTAQNFTVSLTRSTSTTDTTGTASFATVVTSVGSPTGTATCTFTGGGKSVQVQVGP